LPVAARSNNLGVAAPRAYGTSSGNLKRQKVEWMRRFLSLLVFAACMPCVAAKPRPHHPTVSHSATANHSRPSARHGGKRGSARASATAHTAVAMDPERATAIQQALIKSGYLTGEPSGKWDPESIAAMQKLQSDNGWQTKIMPDSRALIKLGLGPGSTPPPAVAGPATTASTTSAPAPHTP
jgi:hypothetical protein